MPVNSLKIYFIRKHYVTHHYVRKYCAGNIYVIGFILLKHILYLSNVLVGDIYSCIFSKLTKIKYDIYL